ncbi:MAG: polysaccharide deacetylase family protein [Novosphingobium sp.]
MRPPTAASMMSRRLLLAIHDVGPRFESAIDRLRDHLGQHAALEKVALLVVPDHWGEAPITAGGKFATRLRSWAAAGSEIFVHGWQHRDTQVHRTWLARFRASHMTAGEGEFLGLDYHAARALMERGRDLIEDITGRPVAGFIAPAWLYGGQATRALADCGFAIAEDHTKVWQPVSGQVLARGPVITWASRSPARVASSLLAARVLTPLLRHARVARVGVHPGDTAVPAIMMSIDRTVASLAETHCPARYADLVSKELASYAS